jgi:hypothetical protein
LVPLADGLTARDVGAVSPVPEVAALFKPLGAALGRYLVAPGNPVHSSATSRVVYAEDVASGAEVALKFMRHRDEFVRELDARAALDGLSPEGHGTSPLVVRVTACHCPAADHAPSAAWAALLRREATPPGDSHPYLLVMDKAGESLHHFLSSQRVAGYDHTRIARLASSLSAQLLRLHGCGRVHFDVKARNALLATSLEASAQDQTVT